MSDQATRELCRILGLDGKPCVAATLRLRVNKAPTLTVQSVVFHDARLEHITERFTLTPVEPTKTTPC